MQLHSARNALEGYIFDTRKLRNGDFAAKFDSEATLPVLEAAEDWLYRCGDSKLNKGDA